MDCFVNRIGSHPERLQNVYFTYALLLRAVKKFGPYLDKYDYRTGSNEEDKKTRLMIQDLIKSTDSCPSTFDEKLMFQGPEAQVSRTTKVGVRLSTNKTLPFHRFSRLNLRIISVTCPKLWTVLVVKSVDSGVKFKL